MHGNQLNENKNKRTQSQDNASKRIRVDMLLDDLSNSDTSEMANEEVNYVLPPPITEQQKEDENKAQHAGAQVRHDGLALKANDELMTTNHNSEEQAEAYLEAYAKATVTDEPALIRKAKAAGTQARKVGSALKTKDALMTMNHYSEAQAQAYIEAYNAAKATVTDEEALILKARTAGARARRDGSVLKTKDILMASKKYSEAQAQAYIEAYKAAKARITDEQALIGKAKAAGIQAIRDGSVLKTKEALMANNQYSEAQAQAYLEAYNAVKARMTDEQALIRKARTAGARARRDGWALKTKDILMASKNYSEAQAQAYLEAYNAAKATLTDEDALISKAKHAGTRARYQGSALKTKEALMANNHYSEAQAQAYIEAYNAAKAIVTDEQALIRKAKAAGAQARYQGSMLKTKEALMANNDYSEAQAQAYIEAYTASSDLRNKSKKITNHHNLNNHLASTTEAVLMDNSNPLLRNDSVAIAAVVPEQAPRAMLNQFSLSNEMKGANISNQAEVNCIDASKNKYK